MPADPLVVVVGLGGVGGHCAHALLRSGLRRLRLIDFDRVSLSSLNRHAVALRRDVGVPKVTACAQQFRAIRPDSQIDVYDEMFTGEAAGRLLLSSAGPHGAERPRLVVDCIDDVKTKVELLAFCVREAAQIIEETAFTKFPFCAFLMELTSPLQSRDSDLCLRWLPDSSKTLSSCQDLMVGSLESSHLAGC
eukprot:s1178_g8.t1